ncbi:hypothetical protein BMS3Abin05_00761 [bacterium BMS3Abin05]|nr:hypothetical protein BMS3Abin05_00761 [bacterium BMS3Abin05]GBE26165.1 hypothetical protein BMS3Bbin03_00076 [bacterium BMS3Bbin03]
MKRYQMYFWAIFFIFSMAGCERVKTPLEPFKKAVPAHEGELNLVFQIEDKEFRTIGYDTLLLKEGENAVTLDSAVTLTIPSFKNMTIYFEGDFQGVESQVIVCYEYLMPATPVVPSRYIMEALQIRDKEFTTFAPLVGYHGTSPQNIKLYIFVPDSDNNNSGTGEISFDSDQFHKRLAIDAAKNTIDYHQKAVSRYFHKDGPTSGFEVWKDYLYAFRNPHCYVLYLFPVISYKDEISYLIDSLPGSATVGALLRSGNIYAFLIKM